jgi:DNA repair exonuclease SbcCD ATPase subunit
MIIFRKLRYKNFLSSGNLFTEITLDAESSTLIIGANGSGKSTMLDALCFGLFGKPFRSVNKPQLINAINQRDAVVEIEFDTGNKSYKIVRGLKPNVFEIYCNGAMLSQNAAVKDYQEHLEKFILKLNYKSFTQIVILGSASFTPFMQLSSADRRQIIEDLLDIQIFSRMNSVLKDKLNLIKEQMSTAKYKIDLTNEKIDMQERYIANLTNDKQAQIASKRNTIAAKNAEIVNANEQADTINAEIELLRNSITDGDSITKKRTKFESLQDSLNKTLTKINKDISFYEENDDCPTCKQTLPSDFKDNMLTERKSKLSQVQTGMLELESKYAEVQTRQKEIVTTMRSISEKIALINSINSGITASLKYISDITEEIDSMSENNGNIVDEQAKLSVLGEELKQLEASLKDLAVDRSYHETAAVLLKDTGIKTKIIRQYIPVINKLVNKYLAAMDFFVNFNLDESFKESIKSRHRDDFSYASFSEGEKQRIDMALMLTWRSVAKLKNSASTNLLILDEVFDSSLDTNGTEDLMKILNMLEATNLFVISHKGDILQDKFRNVIKFEKVNNFSRMAK